MAAMLQRMLKSRRYLVLGLAVLFMLLVYNIQDHQIPEQVQNIGVKYTPLPKPADGRWTWADRQAHFPLESLVPVPTGRSRQLPPIQHAFGAESRSERNVRLQRRKAVKDTFVRCWKSYRSKAWMKDEIAPLTGRGRNFFGGWSASLVDALDTLLIMDMKTEFNEAVDAAMKIDFTTSTDNVINVFETTIRYLGGFLAAYDLSGNINLLHKAAEIGEMLLVPFDTPNHLPITRWRWRDAMQDHPQEASNWMIVSEIGSLSMEFTRLSQLTGDSRWYDAIDRITRLFDQQQFKTKLPGMWPVFVNAKNADLTVDSEFTLGGMSDSLYEYFPKMYALIGGQELVYRKLYEDSISTAAKHLFFRPMTPLAEDLLVAGDVRAHYVGSSASLEPRGQHLTCFAGGMLALGGRLFENEEHVKTAKKLTDGCVWAYNATAVGVMPETARFVPCATSDSCPWDEAKWKAAVLERKPTDALRIGIDDYIRGRKLPKGYAEIPDARYILRPEALESVFYMYRISGDRSYLDVAWEMFNSIDRISRTDIANAAVKNITDVGSDGTPPKDDRMESFWLAETLKYAYLIFSEPDLISLDEYVFNTEAHPFKRPN